MALSVNNLLIELSNSFCISKNSLEHNKIETSIGFLTRSIKTTFGNDITKVVKFGSYDRSTMLKRCYDSDSDVDIMIVFNHDNCGVKAETYRNWLRNFADSRYSRSDVKKNFPTVVLELDHIKFDLVPTISLKQKYYIPNKNNDWIETDPEGFNDLLLHSDRRNNSIVKPIIKLLKAWNCSKDKPYSSYELEKIIALLSFQGHSIESGFFYAIDKLPMIGFSKISLIKLQHLKDDKNWLETYLKKEDEKNSLIRLKRILPF